MKFNNLTHVHPAINGKRNSNAWGQNEGKEIFPTANVACIYLDACIIYLQVACACLWLPGQWEGAYTSNI